MKKFKKEKGITLVALIITIVVLLILAVVTINSIQGDGVIKYAQNAADDYTAKANEEQRTSVQRCIQTTRNNETLSFHGQRQFAVDHRQWRSAFVGGL